MSNTESTETNIVTPETEEKPVEEGNTKVEDTTKDDSSGSTVNTELEDLKKQLGNLESRNRSKDNYIREIQEASKARNQIIQEKEKRITDLQSQVSKDDYLTAADYQKLQQINTLQQSVQQDNTQIQIAQNKAYIESRVPDFNNMIDDVAQEASKQGASALDVQAFKQNPYSVDSATLENLVFRVQAQKDKATLNQRLSDLETKIQSGQANVNTHVQNINQAASSNSITNSVGQNSTVAVGKEDVDLKSLSGKELTELMKSMYT